MAASLPIVLLNGVTASGAGPAILLAYQMSLGNPTSAKQLRDVPIEVYVRNTGTATQTATVQIEVTPDGTSWSSWGPSMVLTIGTGATGKHRNWVGALKLMGIRANVMSYTSGTINAYVKFI